MPTMWGQAAKSRRRVALRSPQACRPVSKSGSWGHCGCRLAGKSRSRESGISFPCPVPPFLAPVSLSSHGTVGWRLGASPCAILSPAGSPPPAFPERSNSTNSGHGESGLTQPTTWLGPWTERLSGACREQMEGYRVTQSEMPKPEQAQNLPCAGS